MIMNNKNKNLSRNRKGRIIRKIKLVDKMKTLFKKIKSEKKKKSNNFDKFESLEIELVEIKYANNTKKFTN